MEKWNVGIFIFDAVEVLDFAGPFEVFSRTRLAPGVEARRSEETAPFEVFTVARTRDAIFATDSYEGLTGPLTCTKLGDCAAPVRFAVYPAADVTAGGTSAVTPVAASIRHTRAGVCWARHP